ncbi:MAG: hypothetical protein JXR86_11645 [Spirochaetales bacterium]|nr:hypothetical protein [Spirochaetales bacterium]
MIEESQIQSLDNYAANSILIWTRVLSAMLKEAFNWGLLKENPMTRVRSVEKTSKEKGTFPR